MPSKSTSDISQRKFKGFHLKGLSKRKSQAKTSFKFLNSSTLLLQSNSQLPGATYTQRSSKHFKNKISATKRSKEVELTNITQFQDVEVVEEVSSEIRQAKIPSVKSVPKSFFKSFCTSAVKKLPQHFSRPDNLSLAGKKYVFTTSSVDEVPQKKSENNSVNKVFSLPNNLTVEAIKYKCKVLQLHDTKCGCSSPRLHIYLTTNHRCSERCSPNSYRSVDSHSPSSSIDSHKKKYIFTIMTGKSKSKGVARKIAATKVKISKRFNNSPASSSSCSLLDVNVRGQNTRKTRKKRMRNEEPESELLGEVCESLPTIMNTLSGDVEYIVLDDNTFNLSTSTKTANSEGSDTSRTITTISEDVNAKPDSLENTSDTKESRNWENILERCLSETSYQSGKSKGMYQCPDNIKVKVEEPEDESTKTTDWSSLAGVCTNLAPSIRDIFGDINIKDEPVDSVDENDMSIDDFNQEIKKLTNPASIAESNSKWPISKVTSLNKEIPTSKGSFEGLLKEEPKTEDSKVDIPPPEVPIKEETEESTNNEASAKDDDDYSSDSSLAPLQIDEGEPEPTEGEVSSIPVQPAVPTARSILLPSVNIISPFKIKIFFGNPHQVSHQVQLEKPHELFDNSLNTAVIGSGSFAQNGVQANKNIKDNKSSTEVKTPEMDSTQGSVGSNPVTPSLTCIYCGVVSADVKALAKHFDDHHKDGLIICYFCQKSFGDRTSMKRHMRTHTGEKPYQCKVCGKRFSLPGNFKKHRDIHEDIRTEPCEICGKTFRRKEHLKYHMRTHTGEKPYMCSECGASFTARYSLQIHMNIHLGKKPYKCTYCTKAFSDKSTMRKHVRVHTGEKPFNCDLCGRCFGESGTLAAHMATHRTERPFKCKQCSLCFKTSGGLRQHEKIHTGEKQYACKYCGAKFLQKYNMTMHERIHTGEKPYACNHCSRSFRSRSCLAKHIVLHGGEEERRYECEHCTSRFYRKAHLRRHIDMHLGIKNYECDICSKKFCARATLDNHLKVFHSQGARRFPCDWCGRVFKRKVYVNTHECIRDPEKVEKYKQELRAAAAAAKNGAVSSQVDVDENDLSSDTDYSSIDIKSEPEEEEDDVLEDSMQGLGEISSVVGNANFDIQEDTIKQEPS